MKSQLSKYLFFLLLALLSACEAKIDAIFEAPPIPVVHCVLSSQDSINTLILTKTIAGQCDAGKMAKIFDSLYFKEAKVWLEYGQDPDIQVINFQKIYDNNKQPGLFSYPDQIVYQTQEELPVGGTKISLFVKIPDLPLAFSTIELLAPP
ncbi:hypothetical protein ACFLRR_00740 [Bacteroidota bacterium]